MRLIPHDTDLGWTPGGTVYIVPYAVTPLYIERYANARGWLFFSLTTLLFLAMYFRSYWVRGRESYLLAGATVALGIAMWPVTLAAGACFSSSPPACSDMSCRRGARFKTSARSRRSS
jgi:hypothetical protein